MDSILVRFTEADFRELAALAKAAGPDELEDPGAVFKKLKSATVEGACATFADIRSLFPARVTAFQPPPRRGSEEGWEDAAVAAEWFAVKKRTVELYGDEMGAKALQTMKGVVQEHLGLMKGSKEAVGVGPRDATLISYANTITDHSGKKLPLQCLATFMARYNVSSTLSSMHLLPMYPWDTDRGFSIMDYYSVDPNYGDWEDIHDLMRPMSGSLKVMFDFVCNHASVENPIVQAALLQRHLPKNHPEFARVQRFKDFVLAYPEDDVPPDDALKKLTRPRPNPVLTEYFVVQTESACKAVLGTPGEDAPLRTKNVLGRGFVWTTFSRGKNEAGQEQTRQVDLNFRNPQLLAEVVRVLLFYVRNGASSIRLDAIGYIWKVLGSASLHERGTHALLEVVRGVMQIAAPSVLTVAEVNEPQSRCIEYLGHEEAPECDMVYQFSAFPLAIHATIAGDASHYASWLNTLQPFKGRQFITVLGSHDGLSQKQARELLPAEELQRLQKTLIEDRGGRANYASAAGEKIVYEICGTPWTLVNGSGASESFDLQLARYLIVLCLGLVPRGMPGIYINGLLGTGNYAPREGLDENRTLNRECFDISQLFWALDEDSTQESKVFRAVQSVLEVRAKLPHFDRDAPPPVVLKDTALEVLAVVLYPPASTHEPPMLVVMNVSDKACKAQLRGLPAELMGFELVDALHGAGAAAKEAVPKRALLQRQRSRGLMQDVAGSANLSWKPDLEIQLASYEVQWLQRKKAWNEDEQDIPAALPEDPAWDRVLRHVVQIFGEAGGEVARDLLRSVVESHHQLLEEVKLPAQRECSMTDACLITYANTFVDKSSKMTPLSCLKHFTAKYDICRAMQAVHLLPMYPWDTDRGFSIMDYRSVDPRYGTWDDIGNMARDGPVFMFDFVCNHASIANPVVQGALLQRHLPKDHPQYEEVQRFQDFVIAFEMDQCPPDEALLRLTRPRAFPVLTKYFVIETESEGCRAYLGEPDKDAPPRSGTVHGVGLVWTTFSRGTDSEGREQTRQVDLNFRNPSVLAEILSVLLFYVRHGARMIRLDAIGYIWKVLGSSSIHERGCHVMLEILYGLLQIAAPGVMTIAEVNEPQDKCFEYLGRKGYPQGDMVYQFSAFPLAVHAEIAQDTTHFKKWLGTMNAVKGRQFVTVLGSHDGLGQKQARGLLPKSELELLQRTLIDGRGGKPNYGKAGSEKIVYEICGTPWNLVNGAGNDPVEMQIGRYIAILCMGLLTRGMPGLYINGLIAATNYEPEGGLDEARTLNRESFDVHTLCGELDDGASHKSRVFEIVMDIMARRAGLPQFDRTGPAPVALETDDAAVLAVSLEPPTEVHEPPLMVLVNTASSAKQARVHALPGPLRGQELEDVLDGLGGVAKLMARRSSRRTSVPKVQGIELSSTPELSMPLGPYEVLWLAVSHSEEDD